MTVATKICGLKSKAMVDAAIAGGADYIGLVFFAKSPRNVSLAEAAILADHARGNIEIVALVVDSDDAALEAICATVRPTWLQLHGRETPLRVASIKQRFGLPILKAVPVETASDATLGLDYLDAADMVLFDAKAPKGAALPGGNGHAFDWSALNGIKGRMPFMLSGGLTPTNVADAILATGAAAVDVSSGVESAPGIKDAALIAQFLRAVKCVGAT